MVLINIYLTCGIASAVVVWGWSRAFWVYEYNDQRAGYIFALIFSTISILGWPITLPAVYILSEDIKHGWKL